MALQRLIKSCTTVRSMDVVLSTSSICNGLRIATSTLELKPFYERYLMKNVILMMSLALPSLAMAENDSQLIIQKSKPAQSTYYESIETGQVFQVAKNKPAGELFLFNMYNSSTGSYSRYETFTSPATCKISLSGAPAPDKVDDRGFLSSKNFLRIGSAKRWKITSPLESDEDGYSKPVTLTDLETGKLTITIKPNGPGNLYTCLEKAGFKVPTRTQKEKETWKEVRDDSNAAT